MKRTDQIRALTHDEVVDAILHGADLCVEKGRKDWFSISVLRKDGAFKVADEWAEPYECSGNSAMHAGMFLLFVAAAVA